MSTALRLDTLSFSKRLRNAGADEALAEAIVEGITGADTSELATKADIADVKSEIADVKSDVKWIKLIGLGILTTLILPMIAEALELI